MPSYDVMIMYFAFYWKMLPKNSSLYRLGLFTATNKQCAEKLILINYHRASGTQSTQLSGIRPCLEQLLDSRNAPSGKKKQKATGKAVFRGDQHGLWKISTHPWLCMKINVCKDPVRTPE